MTDLRKLAERMALKTRPWQRKDAATKVKVFLVDDFERILREHHEGLAEEIVRVLRGFDYVDHVEDEAVMFGEILRVLEGGAAESSGVAADTEVPAPDQPQVTNYDAEAEAQARIAELERELGGYKKAYAGLADDYQRTLRERDEARAERDEHKDRAVRLALLNLGSAVKAPFADNPTEMREVLWEFVRESGWVRLDDATIERVFHEINQGAGTLYDDVIRVLRSLRDGKLKGASDDDA